MTNPTHSPLGASSYSRWKACPGSVRLSAGVEQKESEYAKEGTIAHELAADILENRPYVALDEETMGAVKTYTDLVKDLSKAPGTTKWIEKRFDLSAFYPMLYGTADCVLYNTVTRELHVIDYKHGAGVAVEVKNNSQLMYYGLGAMHGLNLPVKGLVLTIVQPRCYHADGPIRSWHTTGGRVMDFLGDLIDDAKATEAMDAPITPGDHCRWCPAQPQCPALRERALTAARKAFNPVDQYEPGELSDMLHKLPSIEAWIKAVREFAYREAGNGRVPPGWKLVPKRAHRKWKDEWTDASKISREFGLKTPEVIELKIKSPAQVEKLVPKDLKPLLEKMVLQESSGLTLVPVSDERREVAAAARDVFEVVGE